MALSAPVQEAIRRMERRFITASFIQVLVFVLAYVSTLGLALMSREDVVGEWRHLQISDQAVVAALLLLVSWFLAGYSTVIGEKSCTLHGSDS